MTDAIRFQDEHYSLDDARTLAALERSDADEELGSVPEIARWATKMIWRFPDGSLVWLEEDCWGVYPEED